MATSQLDAEMAETAINWVKPEQVEAIRDTTLTRRITVPSDYL